MKTAFFSLEDWEKDYLISRLAPENVELVFFNHALDEDHLPAVNDFEAVSVFIDSQVSKKVIGHFPNLKFIATRSTGYDHIDLAAAGEKGIAVSNVPFYGANTVAEYTFALLLALTRKIFDAYHRLREDNNFSVEGLRGIDLKGKTLGVIGTGNIGRHVISIAKGFGMAVVAYDVYPDFEFSQKAGFRYVDNLDDLLQASDIVTLHVPYLPQTHHLINKSNIFKTKKGVLLINTSRGAVIETEAIIEALKKDHLGGAGLDVLEEEGLIKEELEFLTGKHPNRESLSKVLAGHYLISHPKVIVTPHNAFNTREALMRILDTTADNIVGFQRGKKGKEINQVNGKN